MSGLAFASQRGHPTNIRPIVGRMAAAAAHRGEARFATTSAAEAVAAALEHDRSKPARADTAVDPSGRLIVADSRLDDVAALARRLGLDHRTTSEATLILAAFARWGDGCADQLRGDFAVVIWDAPRGELFAARDIFGMRPLYYAATSEHLLFASEIGQLLASGAVEPRIDDRTIVAALAGRTQSSGWTQFAEIRRLAAGRILRADARRVRTRPFWHPPRRATHSQLSGREYADELRALLETSVGDRLTAADQSGLLLSGGIDSTSIAGTAAEVTGERGGAPLRTYSFGYEGFPEADERAVSGPLTELTGQPNTVIPVADAFPFVDAMSTPPDLDGPELLQSHAEVRRTFRQARNDGVELMMTGHRGDSLFGEGIYDYLGVLRRRGPAATWREMGAQARAEEMSVRSIVQRDLLRRIPAAVWPASRAVGLRRWLRRITPGGVGYPSWLLDEAIDRYGLDPPPSDAVPLSTLAGEARRRRHEALLRPAQAGSAEYFERLCAQQGLRYADPWSDRRIADWVLSIPADRITKGCTDKWVQREAMRGLVPEFARDGHLGSHPGSFYQYGVLEGAQDAVRAHLARPVTAERGYVDPRKLTATYERFQDGVWPGLREWSAFWRWLSLEHWLRAHGD